MLKRPKADSKNHLSDGSKRIKIIRQPIPELLMQHSCVAAITLGQTVAAFTRVLNI
jgi:hypothetical protein